MIRGLPASIIVHAIVFGASYVTFPYWGTSSRAYVDELVIVDTDIVDIGELNNLMSTLRIEPEEPEEEVAPEEPEEVPEEDPLPEEIPVAEEDVTDVNDAPPAEPEPEDVLPDYEAEQPEEEPEVEPEETPPTPRQQRQDDLMNFLNQSETTFKSEIETRRDTPPPQPDVPEEPPVTALQDAPRPAETRTQRGAGERNANQARIDSILYSRIFPCWDGVSDLPFPERLNVRMSLKLNLNGTIDDLTLVEPRRRPVGSSPMGTAVDRALRAVRKCAPYNLPQDDYENWREGAVNLGPAFTPTNPL